MQKKRFHGTWQYLFIESICNDPAVLEQNYRYKMMYSPDYSNVDTQAVRLQAQQHLRCVLSAASFGSSSAAGLSG